MKDPYNAPTHRPDDIRKETRGEGEGTPSEFSLKGPSQASVQKVLDFSKAYEVLDREEGSHPIDLIRN